MLKTLFTKTEKELLLLLPKILRENEYKKITTSKQYIYAKGESPVLLVAHLDTVHKILPKNIYHDENQNVIWSPEGLGADDRAGVYAILQLLKYKPHILFTTGEEIGGIGARAASKNLPIPNVKFIIQLDREGEKDAVFYNCYNPLFTNYICNFGFKEAYGTFSDISILCPAWGIAGVNLSIGYYRQHTNSEYLNVNQLYSTIEKTKNIINNLPKQQFTYIRQTILKAYDYTFFCEICEEEKSINEESEEFCICKKCYDNNIQFCEYCGETLKEDEIKNICCDACYKQILEVM
jgi:hypothetical protein